MLHNSAIEHLAIEVVTGQNQKESVFIMYTYSNPKQFQQRFRTIMHKVKQLAKDKTALVCGDFNAPHTAWGYPKSKAKGYSLYKEALDTEYQLLNDPSTHTRHGTSTQRNTNPDLAFCNAAGARWRNTGETLGSDHCVLEITVPLRSTAPTPRKQTMTDWTKYRQKLDALPKRIDDIDEWMRTLNATAQAATTEVEADEGTPQIDSRLAHLLEA